MLSQGTDACLNVPLSQMHVLMPQSLANIPHPTVLPDVERGFRPLHDVRCQFQSVAHCRWLTSSTCVKLAGVQGIPRSHHNRF
jgi:hypothetical protein